MNVINVIEIDLDVLTPVNKVNLKDMSFFSATFGATFMCIITQKNIYKFSDLVMRNNIEITYERTILNHFARSRLITNLEKHNPEVVLIIMDCSPDSQIIKIERE